MAFFEWCTLTPQNPESGSEACNLPTVNAIDSDGTDTLEQALRG